MKNSRIAKLIGMGILATGMFGSGFGQQHTENKADQTLRGSGRVNPSTLGMEFDLPLGNYSGRGINVPISISYSSKVWRADYTHSVPRVNNPESCIAINTATYSENSASGWTSSLAMPYIEYSGKDNIFNSNGHPANSESCDPTAPPQYVNNAIVKRVSVHLPSGETHELRAGDTPYEYLPSQSPPADLWNSTYYATDGSNIKYIEDSNTSTYQLLLPDGSKYEFNSPLSGYNNSTIRKATKFADRNANFTTYNDTNGTWTDTLGRTFSAPFGLNAPTAVTTQTYTMPGMTGSYKFHWKQLKGNSASESGLTDFSQNLKYPGDKYVENSPIGYPQWTTRPAGTFLFHSEWESYVLSHQLFNPIVLTEIEMPTGQRYKFGYDISGKIDTIKYPTGGEEKFTYATIIPLAISIDQNVNDQTNLGVVNRKVYESVGDTTSYEWTYGATYVSPSGYKVETNNPDGTKSARFLHMGNSSGAVTGSYGYDNGLAGMDYEQRAFDSAGNIVSKTVKHWTVTSFPVANGSVPAHWHPRVDHEESHVFDSNGNSVYSTTKIEYEGDLSQRETPVLARKTLQYGFVALQNNSLSPINPDEDPNPNPTPVPTPVPPTLIRTSETQYLQSDPNIPQSTKDAYKAQNMVGIATSSVVKDASGTIVSRSEMSYDEATYSPNIGRGNPTTSRVWDSTKGNHDNPNAYIATHAKFDIYGNQTESTDAKGNISTTEYDATHHAFPIKVTTPIADPTDVNGSNTAFTTEMTYDPITGLPLTTKDANGQITTLQYDPVTLRPIRVLPPTGAGISETIYHDEPNNYWVKNRSQIDANNWAESITYFDGLGRAKKAEKIDAQGNIFTETEFDYAGRPKRTTNPYRANEAKIWTTNVYDESSRIKEVILPDGAKVKTDYGVSTTGVIGFTKQITDQAGKKRKGITDALGRMVRVIEDPTGQNLATDYVFDTLGNLRKTIQGEQSRYFTFDSLGRLMYAKQPEQEANAAFVKTDSITANTAWSVKYEYDDNGNIVSTTDAKGVSVTATYDNFNRLKLRNYSDTTPDVNFYYDGKGLGSVPNYSKSKMTKVTSSVSETRYTSFDNLGQVKSSQQITNGVTYNFLDYSYNLSGDLISQTYPSGRIVVNTLDADGDIAKVESQKDSNSALKVFANNIKYNSFGGVEQVRLGNGKFETTKYNNRLQVTQIGLGYSATDKGLLKIDYDYGTETQNNGSLREQKINYNGLASEIKQNYGYDDLNRVQSATETFNNGTQSWKQAFSYDRFGNRRFDAANTSTLGQNYNQNIANPTINTSDNRMSSGQGYVYDKSGNLTQDAEGKRYIYDAENHQISYFNSGNSSTTADANYQYDGNGTRVRKIVGQVETIFVYNALGQMVAEYSNQLPVEKKTSYLTTDHLGSPRIVTDQGGQVVSRHDYMAFGDEISAGTANRTTSQKYGALDEIRQQYTGYQRDTESGLDFAQARYYNNKHGRFTSVDPLVASANVKDPQTFNRYSYAMNSPYKFTDPLGLISSSTSACGKDCGNEEQDKDKKPKKKKVQPKKPVAKKPAPPQKPAAKPAQNNTPKKPATKQPVYDLDYVEVARKDYNGEKVGGTPYFGEVVQSNFVVKKDGVALTTEDLAKSGDVIEIEEKVTNNSTTVVNSKGETVDAPQEIKDKIDDRKTDGPRPLFDQNGRQLGDLQGIPATNKEEFQNFQIKNVTSTDKVTFSLTVNGIHVLTTGIKSTKTVDTVKIQKLPTLR